MSTWSDGRTTGDQSHLWSKEKIAEKVKHVNAVLKQLSLDEDFQDDLTLQPVKVAIDHWTGKNRLPPDEAARLQNHRRVMYVFQRFTVLSQVCKEARMGVPLDHLLLGLPELKQEVIISTYREDLRKIKQEEDAKREAARSSSPAASTIRSDTQMSAKKDGASNSDSNLAADDGDDDAGDDSSWQEDASLLDRNSAANNRKSTFFAALLTLMMGLVVMTLAYGSMVLKNKSAAASDADFGGLNSFINPMPQQHQQQRQHEQTHEQQPGLEHADL